MAVIHSQNAFIEKVNNLCNKLSLSDEKFESLSQQAECELRQNRALYIFKVAALALLAYAFIGLVVAVILLAIFYLGKVLVLSHYHGAGAGKLMILLLIPLWAIARSLWITVPEPGGLPVTRDEAPALFALLKDLCKELNTSVDKVLLDEKYNAAVIQIPRFGIFGFHKNILMLGLPLMLTQRPEQLKAVLAHELGHLSGNHSKSSAWIYEVRGRWSQLLDTMGEANSLFFALFLIFFSWFSPRFSAYSLALARKHELEADAEAIKIAGYDNFARSMLTLPLYAKFLGRSFWPGIQDLLKEGPTAPADVYIRLKNQAAGYCPAQDGLEQTIKEALEENGSGTDSHPPLGVRLQGDGTHPPLLARLTLGLNADKDSGNYHHELTAEGGSQVMMAELGRALPTEESAASYYLGAVMDDALLQLSEGWHKGMQEVWKDKYDQYAATLEHLKTLEDKALSTPLTTEELKLKAFLIGQTSNPKECIPVYEEILAREPDEPGIRFDLGMALINDDFEAALTHIKQAVKGRTTLLPDACAALVPMLKARARDSEACEFELRLKQYREEAELAIKERHSVNGDSILEPHGLDEDDLDYLRGVFVELPTINEAYVVRKFVRHLPDCPYLVIGLEMKPNAKGTGGIEENIAIAQWLLANLQLRYQFCVSTFDRHTTKLKKNIVAMDDSLVYHK